MVTTIGVTILSQDFLMAGNNAKGQVAGFCECGYEPSGSIKCGEFLE
jgi:hypothetical protein